MRILALFSLIAAASCAVDPEKYREHPQLVMLPPRAPEKLLRRPPDYSFRDHVAHKQYFIRVYKDNAFEEEVVTVVDFDKVYPDKPKVWEEKVTTTSGQPAERLATLDEHDYAMRVFEEDWLKKGLDERLRYHNRLRQREVARQKTLLDDLVRLSRIALKKLKGWKFDIDADLESRKATNALQDQKEIAFRKKESQRLAFRIELKETQLRILEYKRWLRDQADHRDRSALIVQEVIDVGDVLGKYKDPFDLIEEIRSNVDPEAWKRKYAKLTLRESYLVVRNNKDVVDRVRDYLSGLSR